MMELRLAEHSARTDTVIVEIWDGDQLRGAIYPCQAGIKVISKYLPAIVAEDERSIMMSADMLTAYLRLK